MTSFTLSNVKLKTCLDIFLIRHPEGAAHRPVRPEHIIIAGDFAGGGLSLALLQVIRDSGLLAPAGGVLVSPWCDLTHSFPNISTNTDTVCSPSRYSILFDSMPTIRMWYQASAFVCISPVLFGHRRRVISVPPSAVVYVRASWRCFRKARVEHRRLRAP